MGQNDSMMAMVGFMWFLSAVIFLGLNDCTSVILKKKKKNWNTGLNVFQAFEIKAKYRYSTPNVCFSAPQQVSPWPDSLAIIKLLTDSWLDIWPRFLAGQVNVCLESLSYWKSLLFVCLCTCMYFHIFSTVHRQNKNAHTACSLSLLP